MDRNGLAIQSRELAIRLAKTRGDLDPSTHINPDVNQMWVYVYSTMHSDRKLKTYLNHLQLLGASSA